MSLRNSDTSYGWVSRLLHWLMAAAIIGMLVLGTYISEVRPSLANLWLFGLHKSIGITLLALTAIRCGWHLISPAPSLDISKTARLALAARLMHWALYALMALVPLSGWVASAAVGPDVVIFDRITLPKIAPTSEVLETWGFGFHAIATDLLIVLLIAHVAAALFHQFWLGDSTLSRMLTGKARRIGDS